MPLPNRNRPSNVTRHIRVRATVRELAEPEIETHVGKDRYDQVKRKDPKPMFVAIVVGHEGISGGAISFQDSSYGMYSQGENKKKWFAPAIEGLAGALNEDVPGIVEGHGDQGTRDDLGDILSGYTQDGEQGLEAVGIGYVSDVPARTRINAGELDVASIEGDLILTWDEANQIYIVESVDRVSKVALANSKTDTPGFERAGIVAVVNELMEGGNKTMTGKPSDNFSLAELQSDPAIQLLIDSAVSKAVDPVKADLEKFKAEKMTLADQLNASVAKLTATGAAANAPTISAAIAQKVNALKISAPEKAKMIEDLNASISVADPNATKEAVEQVVADAVIAKAAEVETYRKLYGKPASTEGDFKPDKGAVQGEPDEESDPFLAANPITAPA